MAVVAFDTLEMVKELKAAGFSEPQAEAVTRLVRRSHDVDLSDLATKVDLAAMGSALASDIAATRKGLEAYIGTIRTGLEADMVGTRTALEADILATRTGLEAGILATRTALDMNVAAIRADMKIALAENKAEIIKWMFGTIGFQTLIILGAVIALARVIPG